MSGSVRISVGNAWVPPGWVFDNVLEDIARHVGSVDPELSRTIQESIEGFQYLDASQWSSGRLILFLEGARSTESGELSAIGLALRPLLHCTQRRLLVESSRLGQIEVPIATLGIGDAARNAGHFLGVVGEAVTVAAKQVASPKAVCHGRRSVPEEPTGPLRRALIPLDSAPYPVGSVL